MNVSEFVKQHRRGLYASVCAASVLLMAGTMGATSYAFLNDSKTVTNTFDTATVDISVKEPNRKPDDDQNRAIVPTHTSAKDPFIQNEFTLPIYAYMSVTVPKANVRTPKSFPEKETIELFSYDMTGENWKLMYEDDSPDSITRWYGYTDVIPVEEKTSSLFDTLTYAKTVRGELDGKKLNVFVKGYGIQATTFEGQSVEEVWESFDLDQIEMKEPSWQENRKPDGALESTEIIEGIGK